MAYGVEVTEGVLPKRTNPANSSRLRVELIKLN